MSVSLTFALIGDLRCGSSPGPIPMIGQAVLAVGTVSAVLAEAHHRRRAVVDPVTLDAVSSVTVALTP